jgi:hypothetical protein
MGRLFNPGREMALGRGAGLDSVRMVGTRRMPRAGVGHQSCEVPSAATGTDKRLAFYGNVSEKALQRRHGEKDGTNWSGRAASNREFLTRLQPCP